MTTVWELMYYDIGSTWILLITLGGKGLFSDTSRAYDGQNLCYGSLYLKQTAPNSYCPHKMYHDCHSSVEIHPGLHTLRKTNAICRISFLYLMQPEVYELIFGGRCVISFLDKTKYDLRLLSSF
jgi:hypothetical protein